MVCSQGLPPAQGSKEPSSRTRTKCLGLPAVACSLGEQLTRGCQAEARRAEDWPGWAQLEASVWRQVLPWH